MKILLVSRWPVGGIRTYFRYIYTHELFNKYEFDLVSPDLGELSRFLQDFFPENRIRLISSSENHDALRKTIRRAVHEGDYDLIHSHGFTAGALVERACFWRTIPHIMTTHDVFRDEQFPGLKGKIKKWILNYAYSRLEGVITISRDACENIKAYMPLVRSSRIAMIENGIDAQAFAKATPRDFRNELDLLPSHKIIGFFGRFMPQKGFIDVINAMKILRERTSVENMPFVLTFGCGEYIREDYALIKQMGLSEFFRQLPLTDDMPSAIRGVDLVVMPSRWEACPLLPMEALCAGVPIIGANCIGLRNVIENTPALVISPGSAPELADAIELQLKRGPEQFIQFQDNAISRFDLENSALELDRYYQSFKPSRAALTA